MAESEAATPTLAQADWILLSVQIGRVAPLGPRGVPSGFVKSPVRGPATVGPLGLEGDEQADKSVHGGPEKAVYGYAASRYTEWRADFPEHETRLDYGAFGENLTIGGMTEADLCAGDVHAIGTTLLQVCQPRQPCFKLVLRFGDNRMARAMVKAGRPGWYYRVLQPGALEAGQVVRRVHRPDPALPFERLTAIVNRGQASEAELELLAGTEGVAATLRAAARAALGGR